MRVAGFFVSDLRKSLADSKKYNFLSNKFGIIYSKSSNHYCYLEKLTTKIL